MIDYPSILQTGVQSLLAVACGWCCGKWQVLEADPTVQYTNTLVLKFCIPCLQVWLLAIKTDMRQSGNWSALGVVLLWSMGLQLLLAVHQVLTSRRLQLARLGVDSLLLTTNNTGILGPVVIQAAVGPKYAPLGMLATVVLYFQQLPSAQLLFQLDQLQAAAAAAAEGGAGCAAADLPQHSRQLQDWKPHKPQDAHSNGDLCGSLQQLGIAEYRPNPAAAAALTVLPGKQVKAHASPPPLTPISAAAAALHELSLEDGYPAAASTSAGSCLQHRKQNHGSTDSLQLHYQHPDSCDQQVLYIDDSEISPADDHGSPGAGYSLQQQQQWERGALLGRAVGKQYHQQQQDESQQGEPLQSVASMVTSLLVKNSLVWSTGISLLLSCLGSSTLLDPDSPLAVKQLAFLEQMLEWFAVTTAPLTLFTTGLWMYSNSAKQHVLQQQQHRGQLIREQGSGCMRGDEQLPWKDLCVYLLARATVAPAVMVLLCWLFEFTGDLAHALVILALLPVAQTAFVVCKQHDTGTHAVSCVMVGSLLLMLPQLMVMLAVLERLRVFL